MSSDELDKVLAKEFELQKRKGALLSEWQSMGNDGVMIVQRGDPKIARLKEIFDELGRIDSEEKILLERAKKLSGT